MQMLGSSGGGGGGIPPAALEAMMAAGGAGGAPKKVTLGEVASAAKSLLPGYMLTGLFLVAAPAIVYIAAERRGSSVGELLKEVFSKLPYAVE